MKPPFNIRDFTKEDAKDIQDLAFASWKFTYRDIYSPKEINDFVSSYYDIERLKTQPGNSPISWFLIMEDTRASCLIGYAQIGYSTKYLDEDQRESISFSGSNPHDLSADHPQIINLKELTHIELSRIYLHPDYIGKGLGIKLLQKIEEFVHRQQHDRYYVTAHKDNELVIRFYKKNGFTHYPRFDVDEEEITFMRIFKMEEK